MRTRIKPLQFFDDWSTHITAIHWHPFQPYQKTRSPQLKIRAASVIWTAGSRLWQRRRRHSGKAVVSSHYDALLAECSQSDGRR